MGKLVISASRSSAPTAIISVNTSHLIEANLRYNARHAGAHASMSLRIPIEICPSATLTRTISDLGIGGLKLRLLTRPENTEKAISSTRIILSIIDK